MGLVLLATVFAPAVGAALIWAVAEAGAVTARRVALVTVLVTLALACYLIAQDPASNVEANAVDIAWLARDAAGIDVRLSLGLDGLSLWFFGLSALLSFTAVLVSWQAIEDRAPAFYALLLVLETGMLGVFAARDIILFYIFFEFTLIPLFFLIGIWGSQDRRYAAAKFFLYTFAGSVLTFLGLLALVFLDYHQQPVVQDVPRVLRFSISALAAGLAERPIDQNLQLWIFLALFAGFAIKVPLVPFHTWLPLAHVEAPSAGSVLLAGILLKVGTYGFVRFSLAMLPDAAARCMPYILWLSVVGIVYGALVALAQSDMKRLIAYSSVSHLGFCMLGVFALNRLGLEGGVLQMINHGLSTGGLFAIVGMLYERYHTREIRQLGGLAARTPWLAFLLVFFALSSIGLPGLNGFAGEFLLLLGVFQRGWAEAPAAWEAQLRVISVVAVSGVVLGAWYMLWLIERVLFGRLVEPEHHETDAPVRDASPRDILALAPLAIFIVWIGVQPRFFLDRMRPALEPILARPAAALAADGEVDRAEQVGGSLRGLTPTAQRGNPVRPSSRELAHVD